MKKFDIKKFLKEIKDLKKKNKVQGYNKSNSKGCGC
jgi:hypothetical protein